VYRVCGRQSLGANNEARLGQAVVRVVTSEQTSPCGGARCWTRGRRPDNEPGHPGLRRGAPETPTENAKPLFPRHHLAFSDLRVPEDRQAQAYGRRLLNSPFGEVLASSRPDLPFCRQATLLSLSDRAPAQSRSDS
jgi:hypothetical protein